MTLIDAMSRSDKFSDEALSLAI